jgi:hypothetical protein
MQAVKQYLASIGRKGGKAKGGAKSEAAIANGKLGGRPKKTSASPGARTTANNKTNERLNR